MVPSSQLRSPQRSFSQWVDLIMRGIRTPMDDWDSELYRHLTPSIHGTIPKAISFADRHPVPGRAIQAALLATAPPHASSSGLRLQGVLIDGGFRLSGCDLPRLTLEGCIVRGSINLTGSRINGPLQIAHCAFEPPSDKSVLTLTRTSVDGIRIEDIESSGSLDFHGAVLNGDVSITNAKIKATGRQPAVRLNRTNIRGAVSLETISSAGALTANSAGIQGPFRIRNDSRIEIDSNDRFTIDIRHISAEAVEIHDLSTNGGMNAFAAKITDELVLSETSIHARNGGDAVLLTEASIGASVWIRGSEVHGSIDACEAKIRGDFNCGYGTKVDVGPSEVALAMERTEVGDVWLNDTSTIGCIDLQRARIAGSFFCEESTIIAKYEGLDLTNSRIAGDVVLDGLTLQGRFEAIRCIIDGGLRISNRSRFEASDPSLVAVNLEWLTVSDIQLLGASTSGSLIAANATVRGDFLLNDCRITGIDAEDKYSVSLRAASIGRDLACLGSRFIGSIEASFVEVGGEFGLYGTHIEKDCEEPSLELQGAELGHCFLEDIRAVGSVMASDLTVHNLTVHASEHKESDETLIAVWLSHARIGRLNLEVENPTRRMLIDEWILLALDHSDIGTLATPEARGAHCIPSIYNPTGMNVKSISGFLATDRRKLTKWLNTAGNRAFTVGAWRKFAALYDDQGLHSDALWLRRRAAAKATKASSWRSKPLRYVYGLAAGYGYRPWLALPWIVFLVLIAWGAHEVFAADFYPSNPSYAGSNKPGSSISGSDMTDLSPGYPRYSALGMALASTLPGAMVNTFWATTNPFVLVVLAGLKLLAWGLAALLLAGITGILRKD